MRAGKVRVCFEGIAGCGKSTQVNLLAEALATEEIKPQVLAWPGGTEFGQAVHKLIVHGPSPSSLLARSLLLWADFAELTARYQGEQLLILERHPMYSTLARGVVEPDFDEDALYGLVDALWEHVLRPDVTFVLDVPARVAVERKRRQYEERRKMAPGAEREYEEQLERMRMAYLRLVRAFPEVVIIGGVGDPQDVHLEVRRLLEERIARQGR
ncbi:dTMP kinase [Desulfovirgula thermocuniculi]|uniref:dTMP kinase n=1 Tax=Desulfovirgula thermocuniculi TaxID=348842 RepID=UPI0004054FF1|nr:deoxynucleoside kinase [Desulfovirgula thermocuniculi]